MLWAKAEYPLRAALMASQLCQRLSTNPKLRADSDELTGSYMAYEARPQGCSLPHIWLQPPSHTVAASLTYGCSRIAASVT